MLLDPWYTWSHVIAPPPHTHDVVSNFLSIRIRNYSRIEFPLYATPLFMRLSGWYGSYPAACWYYAGICHNNLQNADMLYLIECSPMAFYQKLTAPMQHNLDMQHGITTPPWTPPYTTTTYTHARTMRYLFILEMYLVRRKQPRTMTNLTAYNTGH